MLNSEVFAHKGIIWRYFVTCGYDLKEEMEANLKLTYKIGSFGIS